MESLLKYFETVHKLSDILYGYSYPEYKQYQQVEKLTTSEEKSVISNVQKRYSIADDEKVKLFFKTILDYYYHKDTIPLNHTVTNIDEQTKAALIRKIPGYFVFNLNESDKQLIEPIVRDKAAKMYDLMDFIFVTLKKVLLHTQKGYDEALKVIKTSSHHMDFRNELHNIPMYLYITFIHIFPSDLRLLLKKSLKIDDLDQKIMDRCHGMIIRHNYERVCNIKRADSPTVPIKSNFLDATQESGRFDFLMDLSGLSVEDKPDISLKSKYSIGMLVNIFSIIQGRKHF